MKQIIIEILSLLTFFSCNKQNIEMVFVEGGSFTMGTDRPIITPVGDTLHKFTSPVKEVELKDFYIGKYEITVREFREFCRQTNKRMPDPPFLRPYGDTINFEWKDEYPMLATWNEANDFARWAGGRLPTEAEWEYAARGGKKTKGYSYSGSDIATDVGWVGENSDSTLHPVGLLKPNELGLYDMTGNLNEWVFDSYNPEKDHLSGSENPTGPPDGNAKISKGVGWYYNSVDKKTGQPIKHGIHMPEVRYQSPLNERSFGFGFRIAKDK